MIRKLQTIKINLTGGIISCEKMRAIVFAAEKARSEEIRFGTRQQLYLVIQENYLEAFTREMDTNNIHFEINDELYPNIVSTYVAQGIFQTTDRLNEKLYSAIVGSIDYRPTLKINITDNKQSFVPFFTGNINFICADTRNYWYLYIRFPKTTIIYRWKDLIHSDDCMRVAKLIEQVILKNKQLFYEKPSIDGGELYNKVQGLENITGKPVNSELEFPDFRLPYYEGLNQYGNKLWLGIYRRDESFPLPFLKDLCEVCQQSGIANLYTTPWKSLIIKDIQMKSRKMWEIVLGKYRINVRHASNELNWQVADLCEEGLNLKRFLIRQFDRDDVRTFGLCFAIKIRIKTGLFGSVIINKQPNNAPNQRKALGRYDILYTKEFNPNSRDYILYRKDLLKEHLGTYLISLCKFYYDEQSIQFAKEAGRSTSMYYGLKWKTDGR